MTAVGSLDELRQRRDEIVALARQHRADKVSVFGSVARDDLQPESDIDFLVDFHVDYALRDHIRLTQGLVKLLGRRVEVVDRRSLRPELRAAILAEAQAL